jgi:dihydroxy-acid dehydratase
MQVMGEALGLMLPGSALMPATCEDLRSDARKAGQQVMELAKQGLKPRDIVTKKSFENAVMVHAAISGSTNSLLHIPAIAHEFGIEIDAQTFDKMHRGAHYLLNIRPSGDWPAQYFYYAGGVPRVMEEIKSMLHLDVMTVTGKTLGENLDKEILSVDCISLYSILIFNDLNISTAKKIILPIIKIIAVLLNIFSALI